MAPIKKFGGYIEGKHENCIGGSLAAESCHLEPMIAVYHVLKETLLTCPVFQETLFIISRCSRKGMLILV